MADPVRWGILGAANFARVRMAPAMLEARGAVLAALATRNPAKAEPFNDMAPGLHVFTGYDELIRSDAVDAVYIPLPNTMHVEWALRALDAGKHVLVEKPAAMQADEFDALIAARDRSGRLAAEAFMIVHHPQWRLARDLIRDGAIGPLRHVQGAFSFNNEADVRNIRNQAGTGGGALRDIGVYPFGATRFATDAEPEDLAAEVVVERGIDTVAHVRAAFPGFTFAAYMSIRMARRQEMVFHGATGVVRLTAPFNAGVSSEAQVHLYSDGEPDKMWRFPTERQYVLQIEAFGRSVREGAAWPVPLEWSRGTQMMIDRALAFA